MEKIFELNLKTLVLCCKLATTKEQKKEIMENVKDTIKYLDMLPSKTIESFVFIKSYSDTLKEFVSANS